MRQVASVTSTARPDGTQPPDSSSSSREKSTRKLAQQAPQLRQGLDRVVMGATASDTADMIYRVLADLLVLLHLAFVVFVIVGGFATWRWPRLAYAHLPAACWGAGIELLAGICPLTPLENHLRALGGEAGYADSFVEHYIMPVLYPAGLTAQHQLVLGLGVVAVNGLAYGGLLARRRRAAR